MSHHVAATPNAGYGDRRLSRFSWPWGIPLVLLVATAISCSSADLGDQLWRCDTNADCGAGWQCRQATGYCVAAYSGTNGVFDDRIVVGMSAALLDDVPPVGEIGRAIRDGIEAYFERVNTGGGIFGRQLVLQALNDSYSAEKATANAEELLGGDDRQAFAMLASTGTETSLAIRDVALTNKAIFMGAGSGTELLEPDPPDRYIFNFRARYSQEGAHLVDYIFDQEPRTPVQNFGVFGQGTDDEGGLDEGLGRGTFDGVAGELALLGDLPSSSIPTGSYVPLPGSSTNVTNAVTTFLRWMANGERVEASDGAIYVGIIMAAVYDSAGGLVRSLQKQVAQARLGQGVDEQYGTFTEEEVARLAKVELRFGAVSVAIGLDLWLGSLPPYETIEDGAHVSKRYGLGTVLAETVPPADSNASGVLRYRQDLAEYDASLQPSGFSLEAYLVAWLFSEALRNHGRDITTESFIDTLETTSADLGIGVPIGFSSSNHQASASVWGSVFGADGLMKPVGLLTR